MTRRSRRSDPGVLILTSLASGAKHGYALARDIEAFAGVTLGPGTLYGAITALEEHGLIEPAGHGARRARRGRRGPPPPRDRAAGPRPGVGAMNPRDAKRVLRWYPAAWRRRYGEELIAMLDDTHGEDELPRHARMSLIRSGLIERIRLLRKYSGPYAGYSIACGLVWAVILAAVWTQAGDGTRHPLTVFCGGGALCCGG